MNNKRLLQVREKVDRSRFYTVDEAIELLKETATAHFPEAAEAAFRLGVNPKRNEHRIRSTVILPRGSGKTTRVLVFAKGEKLSEAEAAGADYTGGAELIKKIQEGWLEFDQAVATPEMMSQVSKLGRILGPRGLMPSPKTGTVTMEVERAVKELKGGRIEFRLDEQGIIHAAFGRCSFEAEALKENFLALTAAILAARPADIKGRYLRSVSISATMGPGIKVDPDQVVQLGGEHQL
ncbi:MAG TPA: 50S ribosomal protein L1 [Candidatus Fraserbacteria bacterium]|nr:50S ribosomal protein L1 [Candidatus Fraserbacteria bacterium]